MGLPRTPCRRHLTVLQTRRAYLIPCKIQTYDLSFKNKSFSSLSQLTLDEEENSIQRRMGNHHANIWSDDFIQSLSSPYGASSYCERVEALIQEVKDIFNTLLENGETTVSRNNLLQLLWMADIVQRFGIDRYFLEEIKAILENVYIYWTEKGSQNAIADLNTTALGFRVLRLNGYDVSPDVFQIFKDPNGRFSYPDSTHQDTQLRSMLNLYRASELSFQGEKIMEEAEIFACQYLKEAHQQSKKLNKKTQLLVEVEYFLKYPWKCRVPRWEARKSIEIYSLDDSWMMIDKEFKMPGTKILELAILDFNILQAQHQGELKYISSWWNASEMKQLDFFKHRHVEYFFWLVCGLFEPEFSICRIEVTKLSILIILFDGIYDTYGTIEELKPFTAALAKWDKIIVGSLPQYMKSSFEFAHQMLEETAVNGEKKHGSHIRKYMQQYWESFILSNLKEAEWIATNYTPSFNEYLNNGVISVAAPIVTLHAITFLDTFLSEDLLEKINKIETLVSVCCRLLDDSRDFQDEKINGENASSIECYVKDNPGSTQEDVLNHINILLDATMQDLKRKILRDKEIPTCYKKVYFDAFFKGLFFIYKDTGGTHSYVAYEFRKYNYSSSSTTMLNGFPM